MKKLLLIVFLILCIVPISKGLNTTSNNYEVNIYFGNGGQVTSSGDYNSTSGFGQTYIGLFTETNNILEEGIYYLVKALEPQGPGPTPTIGPGGGEAMPGLTLDEKCKNLGMMLGPNGKCVPYTRDIKNIVKGISDQEVIKRLIARLIEFANGLIDSSKEFGLKITPGYPTLGFLIVLSMMVWVLVILLYGPLKLFLFVQEETKKTIKKRKDRKNAQN